MKICWQKHFFQKKPTELKKKANFCLFFTISTHSKNGVRFTYSITTDHTMILQFVIQLLLFVEIRTSYFFQVLSAVIWFLFSWLTWNIYCRLFLDTEDSFYHFQEHRWLGDSRIVPVWRAKPALFQEAMWTQNWINVLCWFRCKE